MLKIYANGYFDLQERVCIVFNVFIIIIIIIVN